MKTSNILLTHSNGSRIMSTKKYIPSFITSINLALGVTAILINDPSISPWLIFISAILDVFDGAIARKLDAITKFGGELDSLADLVSFGMAPAYLYYSYVLTYCESKQAIAVTVILVIFGALRLAKYNSMKEKNSDFFGMPIPTSGLFFAFLAYEAYNKSLIDFSSYTFIWLILPIVFSLLMVSNFTFFSIKKSHTKKKKVLKTIFTAIFFIGLYIAIATGYPAIPIGIILYIGASLFLY